MLAFCKSVKTIKAYPNTGSDVAIAQRAINRK